MRQQWILLQLLFLGKMEAISFRIHGQGINSYGATSLNILTDTGIRTSQILSPFFTDWASMWCQGLLLKPPSGWTHGFKPHVQKPPAEATRQKLFVIFGVSRGPCGPNPRLIRCRARDGRSDADTCNARIVRPYGSLMYWSFCLSHAHICFR